jgi:hypothetical protein
VEECGRQREEDDRVSADRREAPRNRRRGRRGCEEEERGVRENSGDPERGAGPNPANAGRRSRRRRHRSRPRDSRRGRPEPGPGGREFLGSGSGSGSSGPGDLKSANQEGNRTFVRFWI